MRQRRALYRDVVDRLERDGALADELSPAEAVDLIWALLSSRVHEDLVVDRRWSRRRYEKRMRTILHRALLAADSA